MRGTVYDFNQDYSDNFFVLFFCVCISVGRGDCSLENITKFNYFILTKKKKRDEWIIMKTVTLS